VKEAIDKESTGKGEEKEKRLPSLDVAEARIAKALIKYKIRVARGVSPKEEEKVRL
jgi:hypothetical protein